MNAPAPNGLWRIWLAGLLAFVAGMLAMRGGDLLTWHIRVWSILPAPASHAALTGPVFTLFTAGLVECCKAAAIALLLRRRWADWAPLGAIFGLLMAMTMLVSDVLVTAGFTAIPPEDVPWRVARIVVFFLLHGALGLLAAAAARAPGGPWLAIALASVWATVLAMLPLEPLVYLMRLPEPVFAARHWIMFALHAGFALAVWRWLPAPAEPGLPGPARVITVVTLGSMLALALGMTALVMLSGPNARDPVWVLVVALGAVVVAGMVYRHAIRPWMRQGG